MRTTLTLDDDVAALVVRQATLRGLSLGKAVSDSVRRGLSAPARAEVKDGVTVFRLPPDSPTVTMEQVQRFKSEGA